MSLRCLPLGRRLCKDDRWPLDKNKKSKDATEDFKPPPLKMQKRMFLL